MVIYYKNRKIDENNKQTSYSGKIDFIEIDTLNNLINSTVGDTKSIISAIKALLDAYLKSQGWEQ